MTKRIACYPGTFDPITHGHSDVILRSAKLYDEVVVGVASRVSKQTWFTLDERVEMTQTVLAGNNNVRVVGFEGLTVDFAKEYSATVILRGLRAVSDFDFEFQLATTNRRLSHELETMFIPASSEEISISSSIVREIARAGGDVSSFVDPYVVECLSAYLKRGE